MGDVVISNLMRHSNRLAAQTAEQYTHTFYPIKRPYRIRNFPDTILLWQCGSVYPERRCFE